MPAPALKRTFIMCRAEFACIRVWPGQKTCVGIIDTSGSSRVKIFVNSSVLPGS